MRNRISVAQLYANLYATRIVQVANETKQKVVDNKSELTHIAATSAVVYLASRTAGFKAGYKFAKNTSANA